jgi:hypothetical protein
MGEPVPPDLAPDDFEAGQHRIIFEAIRHVAETGGRPDLLTVKQALKAARMLDAAGGADYIADLTSAMPSRANFAFHLGELKKTAYARKVKESVDHAGKALADGHDPAAVAGGLSSSIEQAAGKRAGGFRFTRIDTKHIKPHSWIVKGMMETDSLSCIYGEPGAGKSFLAVELAAAVATGRDFFGLPVKNPGPVIYFCGEGQSGIERRFRAWETERGVDLAAAPFPIIRNETPVMLIQPETTSPLFLAMKDMIKQLGRPPALVIVDTWSRNLGGDDSDPRDAAQGVAVLDRMRMEYGHFGIAVIHHTGNGDKNRARGWSGLRGACDSEFQVTRCKDGTLTLKNTKQKDAAPLAPLAFQFHTVPLGICDDDGNAETSAVLERTESVEEDNNESAPDVPALGKNQAAFMEALDRLTPRQPANFEGYVALLNIYKDAGIDRRSIKQTAQALEKKGLIQVSGQMAKRLGERGSNVVCRNNTAPLKGAVLRHDITTPVVTVVNEEVTTNYDITTPEPSILPSDSDPGPGQDCSEPPPSRDASGAASRASRADTAPTVETKTAVDATLAGCREFSAGPGGKVTVTRFDAPTTGSGPPGQQAAD